MEGKEHGVEYPIHQGMETRKTVSVYWICDIDKTQEPRMIRHLQNISFPNLGYMTLGKNDLESIEGLASIHLPLLMEISVGKL